MQIRVFAAGHGDCLLLSTEHGNILVDGGMPDAYKKYWANFVGTMRDQQQDIDLICVSHIDRDHIGGILSMLNNEKDWRLHARRAQLPQEIRPRKKPPDQPRPPDVKSIWHNSFFDAVRMAFLADDKVDALQSLEVSDILNRTGSLMAGAGNHEFSMTSSKGREIRKTGSQIGNQLNFLGQSVAEAIDVSRRIHANQLDIPLNSQFDGEFVLRRNKKWFRVARMTVRVLGPSKSELANLVSDWKEYLIKKANYLAGKAEKHDKIDGHLSQTSLSNVLDQAKASAIALAGNEAVTPPNLASIVMHVKHNGKSILLTGDADENSILAGLRESDLLEQGKQAFVDVLKVPHHGADNSYSDNFARTVIAEHYVFCSDGANDNPEIRVMTGYLDNLFGNAAKNIEPALSDGRSIKFWFNYSQSRAQNKGTKVKNQWAKMVSLMEEAKATHGDRFQFEYLENADSFVIE